MKVLLKNIPEIVRQIGKIVSENGDRAFLVGGPVRDLILKRDVVDIDFLCEKDAIKSAEAVNKEIGGVIKKYPEFGTVSIKTDNIIIDFATARKEVYKTPGSLPSVSSADIIEDLQRRDFTINAAAMDVSPENLGYLIDPFNGIRDIHQGIIKILHPKSFREDPTRILRALRFASRFGFKIDRNTEKLLRENVWRLKDSISAERRRKEVISLLKEGENTVLNLEKYGVLPVLMFNMPEKEHLNYLESIRVENKQKNLWFSFFLLLTESEKIEILSKFYNLRKKENQQINILNNLDENWWNNEREIIHTFLRSDTLSLYYLQARYEPARSIIARYLKFGKVRIYLTGKKLKQMGFQEGEVIGEIKNALIEKHWMGEIETEQEEIEYVSEQIGK